MKCYDPILVFHTDKKRHFRHFSLARKSPLLRSIRPTSVFDCGTCIHCRQKRSRELARRCVLHASLYKDNCFLTLTYDESRPGYHNNLSYRDVQLFKKNLRSYVTRNHQKRIEIFNVHEYGKNGKKHWHLIVFNFNFADRKLFTTSQGNNLYNSAILAERWPHGFSTIGDVSEASALYQAQYMEKDLRNGNTQNAKKSKSNHSGIGKAYFLRHYKDILRLGYIPFGEYKMPIPRYFQKIAHRHYCHFFEPQAFFKTHERKKPLHRPFKIGEENLEIATLFKQFRQAKELRVQEMEKEFDEVVQEFLRTKSDPNFVLSGENTKYDLNKQIKKEIF